MIVREVSSITDEDLKEENDQNVFNFYSARNIMTRQRKPVVSSAIITRKDLSSNESPSTDAPRNSISDIYKRSGITSAAGPSINRMRRSDDIIQEVNSESQTGMTETNSKLTGDLSNFSGYANRFQSFKILKSELKDAAPTTPIACETKP